MKRALIPVITVLITVVAGIAFVIGKQKRKKDSVPEIKE